PATHGGSAGPRAHATGEADTRADADGFDAGILVEPGDARALAGGIVSLLESEETRTRFGRVGRRRAVTTYS
ncbi:MAG TPA: glycosyl transferase family 1, partial [Dermacoccus sp.]|nr:glycosyl transferase family 1 [Dermacoccus sp.]